MYDSIKLYILYTDEPESFIIMWYYNVTPSNVGYRSDLGLPKDTPLLGYKEELSSAFCVFQAEIWASLSSCTVIKPIMSTCILGKKAMFWKGSTVYKLQQKWTALFEEACVQPGMLLCDWRYIVAMPRWLRSIGYCFLVAFISRSSTAHTQPVML